MSPSKKPGSPGPVSRQPLPVKIVVWTQYYNSWRAPNGHFRPHIFCLKPMIPKHKKTYTREEVANMLSKHGVDDTEVARLCNSFDQVRKTHNLAENWQAAHGHCVEKEPRESVKQQKDNLQPKQRSHGQGTPFTLKMSCNLYEPLCIAISAILPSCCSAWLTYMGLATMHLTKKPAKD